ncbi:MAG: hypothetical protein IGS39_04995 [Calothrix sp. C42_A2020_038]|nr:hypothetical protein [Calothrix sp. C42_A2020_038]
MLKYEQFNRSLTEVLSEQQLATAWLTDRILSTTTSGYGAYRRALLSMVTGVKRDFTAFVKSF